MWAVPAGGTHCVRFGYWAGMAIQRGRRSTALQRRTSERVLAAEFCYSTPAENLKSVRLTSPVNMARKVAPLL